MRKQQRLILSVGITHSSRFLVEELTVLLLCGAEGMIDPEIIAEALVKQATANSTNLEKKSPFAEYAEKEGYIYIGGREDDVTAVVSYVVPQKN